MIPVFSPDDSSGYRAALEAAPTTMLVVAKDGRIVFANARAEGTFGRPRAELVGTPLEALLAIDGRSLLRDALASLRPAPSAHGTPAPMDLFGLHRNGEQFAIEVSLAPFVVGGVPTAVVVVREFTAHGHVPQVPSAVTVMNERQARERLEALLAFAPAFIIGIDLDGSINFINRLLPQYAMKDVLGTSWLQYFAPERHPALQEALRNTCATGAIQTYEVATPGPDGAMVWFASQIAPVRIDGQIAGAVLVSQDVTEKKRQDAELVGARHMAVLGTLAAGVAHEINTPIQFVGDSLQFLRDATHELLAMLGKLKDLRGVALKGARIDDIMRAVDKVEDDADLPYLRENMPAAFDVCVDGLQRVTNIVRSLKEFAHPAESEMVPADLNRAIQSTLTLTTNEYKYVADLQTDFGDLPLVTCHLSEINQAVLNIVVNAAHAIGDVVKGSGGKGLITVRTRREGDSVVIAISDTGGGIPEKIRSRIFDPFFTTKEIGKGTGQGLSIAWSTVKNRHGGELTFETRVPEGTTFSIRLPIAGKEASLPAPAADL